MPPVSQSALNVGKVAKRLVTKNEARSRSPVTSAFTLLSIAANNVLQLFRHFTQEKALPIRAPHPSRGAPLPARRQTAGDRKAKAQAPKTTSTAETSAILDQAVQRFRKQQIPSQLGLYGVNKKKVDRAVYF